MSSGLRAYMQERRPRERTPRRREMTGMHGQSHHDRIVRLVEARLQALEHVSAGPLATPRAVERQVLALAAATRHAVRLEILSPEEADAIWACVAERHPRARWCLEGPGLAA